jgi:hypothetical protein
MVDSDLVFEGTCGSSRPNASELLPVVARKLFCFADRMDGFSIARFEAGPNDDPLILLDNLAHWPRNNFSPFLNREDYLRFEAMMESNNRTMDAGEAKYKIIHFRSGDFIEVNLGQVARQPIPVQPLGADHYLLCAQHYSDEGKNNENGIVVDRGGNVVERFRIGTAVEAMKTTKNGNIWTCYCDEGVFSDDAISRLVVGCFDQHGKHLYPDKYISVFDYWCNNINVESDDSVWFSPTMTGLVQVENFAVKTISAEQQAEIGAFAISGERALWAPFQQGLMSVDPFVISNLQTSKNKFFQAVDEEGQVIKHEYYAACGSKMYFVANHDVYVIDLKDVQI